MKTNKSLLLIKIVLFSVFFVPVNLYPITVGSDSAPSRQTLVTLTGTSNTILGFAALDGGFYATDTSTSFTFNSFFPINDGATFNGGTCYAFEDIMFAGAAEIVTTGSIVANNNNVVFAPRSQGLQMPLGILFKQLSSVSVVSNALAVAAFPNNNLVAVGNISSTPNTLSVYGVVGNSLTLAKSFTTSVEFFDLTVWPTSTGNTTYIVGGWGRSTAGLYSYSYNLTTSAIAFVSFSGNGASVCAFRPVPPYILAAGSSSQIMTFSFSSSGVISSTPMSTLVLSSVLKDRAIAWDYSGTYLAIGTTSGLQILRYNGASLSTTTAVVTGPNPNMLAWSPDGNWLALANGAYYESLRVYYFDRNALTLTEQLSFRAGISEPVDSVAWSSTGSFLACAPWTVGARIYYVDYVRQRLLLDYRAPYNYESTDIAWSYNDTYLFAPVRTVNLMTGYTANPLVTTYLNAAKMVVPSDVALNASMRLKGANLLDLQGHTLDLNGNSIVLESGATLMLSNATILNMGQSNIQCIDNTCTLTLFNVHGWLNNNFNFNTGRLTIIGDVMLSGSYAFSYGSTQNLSIINDSQLLFDSGMTFSYGSTSSSLITFQDRSSTLYLYETLVYTSNANGLTLINGTLTVDGDCPVYSQGGLVFGNGTAANNLYLNILPDSGLTIRSGFVKNNNV